MLFSSKKRGAVRGASGSASKSRGQQAVRCAIETLETRRLLTTVTYLVEGNSDSLPPILTPSGVANQVDANTLRAAINSANSQPFPTIIKFNAANFPGGVSNIISLTSGLTLGATGPGGTHSFTLVGPTGSPIVISGGNLYEDFQVNVGIAAEFEYLTIADGMGVDGGGIASGGALTLIGDTFSSNTAPGGEGGAIFSSGQLTVTNSTFTSNSAEDGGAIFIEDVSTTNAPKITGSTFTGNTATNDGGAIENLSDGGSTFTVSTSKFSGNSTGSADLGGGAIYSVATTGNLTDTITSSTFTNNSTAEFGGALYTGGKTLTLTADTFTGDKSTTEYGGAIFSIDDTLTATSSTFNNDIAFEFGGGIYYAGLIDPKLTVTSCTFTSDATVDASSSSEGYGAAICDDGGDQSVLTISNSSFTNDTATNYGGAIYSQGDNNGGANSVATITSDTFTGDSALAGDGGALDSYDDTLVINGSTFTSDTDLAGFGGGVNTYATTLTVSNDKFTNDSAYGGGGGLEFYGAGTGTSGGGTSTTNIVSAISGGTGVVTSSTFTGDLATAILATVGDGGAIQSSSGEFTVNASTFTNNSAVEFGGGIDSTDTTLNAGNDVFTNNAGAQGGGGIYFAGSVATVSNATFTSNTASNGGAGGGIDGTSDVATLTANNDTFTSNSAGAQGGAISFLGTELDVWQSTFNANSSITGGGGILAGGATSNNIFDSTFNTNSTGGAGGGVNFNGGGNASLANDTFFNNSANGTTAGGGGLYANSGGTATVTDSTFDHNSAGLALGGGIQNDPSGGDVILDGDIVALNSEVGIPTSYNDLAGTFDATSANNLIGDGAGQTGFTAGGPDLNGNYVGSNLTPINPMLGALANNGGPTQTQIPAKGSLAIGHSQNFTVSDSSGNDVTANDQTGLNSRPQNQGYDIGAYETGNTPVVVTPTLTISNPAPVHVPSTGTTTVRIPLVLNAAATSAIVITYDTEVGTASKANGDYAGVTNATYTIPAGSPAGTYYITISGVKHTSGTYPKNFYVKLVKATNATALGGTVISGTHTVNVILDYP